MDTSPLTAQVAKDWHCPRFRTRKSPRAERRRVRDRNLEGAHITTSGNCGRHAVSSSNGRRAVSLTGDSRPRDALHPRGATVVAHCGRVNGERALVCASLHFAAAAPR